MELRDYIRMLRRGWPVIVLVTALVVALSALYITVAPKSYEASTTLLVSGQNPTSVGELQEANTFAAQNVVTYGKIILTDTVLGPAGASAQPPRSAESLYGAVTAVVPETTTLIILTASASDPEQAAILVNAVAATATKVIPALQANDSGRAWVDVQQLRPAAAPSSPVSPDARRVLALGFIVGLCLGLALTISAQTLDTRIRRADDVRALTDVPLLAEIRHQKRRGQHHALAVRDEPVGATGEAFRTLRTNLGFMEPRDRRSLVFAAVTEDRNDAQVPANLAWSLAQAGWSVLLVDLDLRRSIIAETIGIRSEKGLADILLGKRNLPEVVNDTLEPRLRVVTAGTPQASPSDLLSGPAMNNLLRRMEKEYDYVILHAPPLLSYTDAALVSQAAGGSVVTVAAGRTRAQELTTAMTALANVRIKPAGLVLTGTRRLEGLAGLVRGRPGKRPSGSGTSVGASVSHLSDAARITSSTSVPSPSEATLYMTPPGPRPAGGRPSTSGASPRPRPALRPSQPVQSRPAAVQPVSARHDPMDGPPPGAPSVAVVSFTAPPVEEHAATEHARTEHARTEHAPIEHAPIEETPIEHVPTEETPIEQAPIEETPIEETPIEHVPTEETPIEQAPVEELSVTEPTEETPIEQAPVEEPSMTEPTEETPAEESSMKEPSPEESPPVRATPPTPGRRTSDGSDDGRSFDDAVADDTGRPVVRPGRPG